MSAADIEQKIKRFRQLESDAQPWRSFWEVVARFCAPRRMGAIGQRSPGDRRVTPQIYNPIGISCVQTLAAAMHGMLMNPATRWMRIRLTDDALDQTDIARQWTDEVSRRIMNALSSPEVNFHTYANQLLEDIASLGTGLMYIGRQDNGHLFTKTHPIYEAVVTENKYGRIDTVIRCSEWTVAQMIDEWGNKVSPKVKEQYDKGDYDKKHRVLHYVAPRHKREPGRDDNINMPIEICYIEEQYEHEILETGAEEMPYVVPRWWVTTGEVYGRSPAMTALPQIKIANAAQKTMIEAAEKAVNPPLTVPHEGLVSPVRQSPGGVTYLRNKMEIGQIPTSSNLPFASQYMMALNDEIRSMMFVDQIQFTGDFQMTATEVIQRNTERMRLLGPVLGRTNNEFLNPLVTRVFGIMYRLKQLPPPPDELRGQDMRIEYMSPLARAQKTQLAQGFSQAMMTLEPLAKLDPQIAQKLMAPINFDAVTPEVFDWFGVDSRLLLDAAGMEQQARMEQFRQLLDRLPELAKAAQSGAAGVKDIAGAGQTGLETLASMQQMPGGMQPASLPPGQNPAENGQVPNISSLLGALTQGAGQAIPPIAGNPADFVQGMQR